ncbi:MAG: lipid IV(A) 3-deoxy-D-manno-octulosonic acid transferase [Burkholderiales bacterium]|nr:lipid IV(A) 3-deoxy-D-manno-octulosonic acid transferase [Burkholderiales bacterium]
MARAAYALLLRLALPLYFARLWWRGRQEPEYRRHWRERLGGGVGAQPPARLWIHAVSLGETRAAEPLIAALRAQQPGLRLLLTHGTATGREAGRALLHEGDAQAWLPYDTPGAVRRFLRRHRPRAGVLLETEVWPALLHAAQQAGVPMMLANARLSARSQARGERLAVLMRPAVAAIGTVLAQTEADAARLRALGAGDVRVLGNLKFDMAPPPALLDQGRAWRSALGRPVVLAAATREGEEAPLLQAWAGVRGPRPLLVLVPRHPQRFDAVVAMVSAAGLNGLRRSAWRAGLPPAARDVDVWVGDSLGEMPLYYALADVALLGGSYAPLGGQNLIEAAACGCPLLIGPHTFNFAQAAELALAAGAAERCADLPAAVRRALEVASDPARAAWSARALAFAGRHRGAAERMAAAVLAQLPPQAGGSSRVPAAG